MPDLVLVEQFFFLYYRLLKMYMKSLWVSRSALNGDFLIPTTVE